MKLRYILFIVGLSWVICASSMDISQLYRETQEEITKEEATREAQIPADKILLMSSDGQEFLIPIEVAKQSETLKHTIEDVGKKIIPLANISGKLLKEIVDLLTTMDTNKNLKGKKLLDTLEQKVAIADPFELLRAANYLDIPVLLNLAASKIAQQEISKSKTTLFAKNEPTLREKLVQIAGVSAQDILNIVAKYFFLLSGTKLKNIPENSYSFSIQDWFEYQPNLFKPTWPFKRIDLSNHNINNLEGIDTIPDIETVAILNLNNNQITQIPSGLLHLNNLKVLRLANNQINTIPKDISQLRNLAHLNLNNNQIREVPAIINSLITLEELYLEHNAIDRINPTLFNSMYAPIGNLIYLKLGGNRLTQQNKDAIRNIVARYPYRWEVHLSL